MTAYTKEVWSSSYPYSINTRSMPMEVKTVTLDFTKQNMGSTDTIKLLPISAGTYVFGVWAKLITVEGATLTIGIGDSGSATTYHTTFNCNSASNFLYSNVSGAGKLYTAADDLLITCNTAGADVAVVQIGVIMLDCKYQ